MKGIICQGDLPNIKGAIPPIQNLLSVAPPRRTSCDLSRYHRDAFRNFAKLLELNASCVYNTSLSAIIED
jgi:hypothetical protein